MTKPTTGVVPCTSPVDLCTALDSVVGTLLKLAIAARDFADASDELINEAARIHSIAADIHKEEI